MNSWQPSARERGNEYYANNFMAAKVESYALPKDQEPTSIEWNSKSDIKNAFTSMKTQFADRTPAEERESLKKFFELKDLSSQRNVEKHYDVLKANPAFATRNNDEVFRIASKRAMIEETINKRGVDKETSGLMLEKFDKAFEPSDSLEKVNAVSLDTARPEISRPSSQNSLSH